MLFERTAIPFAPTNRALESLLVAESTFQALVESTLQRKESVGKLVNQAMRDGTLQEAASSEACAAS